MTRASLRRFIRSWGWSTSICRVRRPRLTRCKCWDSSVYTNSGAAAMLCHRSLFTELLIPDTREWLKWVEFLQNIEEDFLLESFTDFVKCCSSGNKSRLISERTIFCECLGVFGWMTKSEDRGLTAETQREILEENLAWQGTCNPVSGKEKRVMTLVWELCQNYNKEEETRVFWHIVACFPRMTQRVPSVGLWDFITCAVSQTQYVNCDYSIF